MSGAARDLNESSIGQALTIIQAKLRMGAHQVASVRGESKLKVGVISVSAIGLWVGAFFLFYFGFDFLMRIGNDASGEFNFGDLLMGRMLSIFGLAVFMLLIFSNILVAFSTMYRSKEVVYLLQAPISFENFFYARFFESVAFSSWSLAYLGSPLMLAYGLQTKASLLFYPAAILFYLPFILVPAAIGVIIAIVLVRIFPRLNTFTMIVLAGGGVALFGGYIFTIIRGTRVSESDLMPAFIGATARMQSPFLPSLWTSEGILAAAQYNFPSAAYYFALILSTALFSVWLTGKLAAELFYPGYAYLMGQDKQRIKLPGRGPLGWLERRLQGLREPLRGLTVKDIKLFWRDPTQWSQFVIFFGIMAIYIANLRNTSRYFEEDKWRLWVASLNTGALSLILATLTSRFVFPLISLEGRRFWILGLAPLTMRQLVWQKFTLSVSSTSVFTVPLAVLSGYMLQLEPLHYVLTVYTVIIANFALSGLAVGLGALYPNFLEDNPARIVSGMGGTLNLLVSVGYIILIIAAQIVVLQSRLLGLFESTDSFYAAAGGVFAFTALLTLAATVLPLQAGLRNLRDSEF